MDKEALRELAEDLAMNHEYCPKDVILKASDALLNLLAEIQSLTKERTALLVTAENAEAELKAIKEAEPVAWVWKYANGEEEVVFVGPDVAKMLDPSECDVPSTITPLYTLQGESK